ncbi:family 1 glycosylhydrolase [Herbiconiux moechotypicola]|uniref:GH1 family beta-glucosidase n=1 Tax=Herbiconiux moechotypicola TaxID=637393 RepID=A0ABP5QC12_9MICO|nr:family 1 glycosylhydrolase [Herbiconiux moechotypicola]MCS5729598.1 family 1 glycosylhydrolase [Herbiconiux moechotypicola]
MTAADPHRLAARFPAGFRFGVATSAYQIEGAAHRDGKGPSIWDTFTNTPGRVDRDVPGDRGAGHYDRWRDDVQTMRELGLGGYRFSLSWPRLFPEGVGARNPAGFDFYRRLIDSLLEAGIEPHVTLYHWDLPQALEDRGGWANPDVAGWFGDYAAAAFEAFGDTVPTWATLNEPISMWVGYGMGLFAPGHRDARLGRLAMHHAMRAHARGVQAFRASRAGGGGAGSGGPGGGAGVGGTAVSAGAQIGIAVDVWPRHPETDSEVDRALARREEETSFRFFLDAALRGEYPETMVDELAAAGLSDAEAAPAPLEPIDFVGVNVYSRSIVSADRPGAVWWQPGDPHPGGNYLSNGQEFYPAAAREALAVVREEYGWRGPVQITENGFGESVPGGEPAPLDDAERIRYVAGFLEAIADAVADGSDVRAYYLWTLMDNFEWAAGYSQRFGLHAVDEADQHRTPKASARWYREFIAAHREARHDTPRHAGDAK